MTPTNVGCSCSCDRHSRSSYPGRNDRKTLCSCRVSAFFDVDDLGNSSVFNGSEIAGLDADAADVVSQVQAFLELPELFIALDMVEFGRFFRDGVGRAESDASSAGFAVALQRLIGP